MSIAPVESFPPSPPARTAQASNASAGTGTPPARPAPAAAESPTQPVSGSVPKPETPAAKNVPANYELPRDVVEVHQDPASKGQIIIQYLDKAGNVVVQVPSAEELSVERGIADEFQQAAKLRASDITAAAETAGGKSHGY